MSKDITIKELIDGVNDDFTLFRELVNRSNEDNLEEQDRIDKLLSEVKS